MSIASLGKIAAMMLLGLGLSACVDAGLDVALLSERTASATLTQDMRQDGYTAISLVDTLDESLRAAAVKAAADATKARTEAAAAGKDGSEIVVPEVPAWQFPLTAQFCTSGRLLKRGDGGATCMDSSEGAFGDIYLGQLDDQLSFTPEADGTVRIALSTAQLRAAMALESDIDPELKTSIPALFAGRKITVKFSGAAVTDTNMTLAKDGTSASQAIFILDLLSGKAELPDELYAVVRAP